MLIADGIRAAARRTPSKIAIVEGGRRLTYSALIERIDRVANWARGGLELRHGDRAALLLPNCLEYLELVCGLSSSGVAAVPIGPVASAAEIRFVCDDARTRVLFVAPALEEAARAAAPAAVERIVVLGNGYESELARASSSRAGAGIQETDVFSIPYTSGSTGRPKGVMLTHRGRVLSCYAMAAEHGCYGPDDRAIATTPMFHGAGFLMALAPVFFGGALEILPRFEIEQLLAAIQRFAATSAYMVPTHFSAMLAMGEGARRYDLRSLKAVISGTAPLAQAAKERVIGFLGEGKLFERYGSTEASIVTTLRPADQLRKVASVGLPFHATHVQVVGVRGDALPPGQVGELAIASPYLFAGYLNLPEVTAQAMRGDWFVSGDLARQDEEGYVYLVDRKNDMIISGGENVYPREVEEVLLAHPAVAECGVVGLAHEYWGEAVTAFVVLRPGAHAHAAELEAACQRALSRYKVPKAIRIVASLPRNNMGKVSRRALREAAAAGTIS